VRLAQRVRTSASPSQVWQVLGRPSRWPEFELVLKRVRGGDGPVAPGQTLMGVSRFASLAVPIDVLEAVPGSRLVLRVHAAPGVVERLTFEVVPLARGGSDISVSVVVEGLFARAAVLPLWLGSALTTRVLGVRAERLARAARSAA